MHEVRLRPIVSQRLNRTPDIKLPKSICHWPIERATVDARFG